MPLGRYDDQWDALLDAVWVAFRELVDSPGRFANMVSPNFNVIGVVIAISDREVYATQNFAIYP